MRKSLIGAISVASVLVVVVFIFVLVKLLNTNKSSEPLRQQVPLTVI